jgi:hypothetical protein
VSGADRAELAVAAIAAINSGDPASIKLLLHPEAKVTTGRSVYSGLEQIAAWAAKRYDHIDRLYSIRTERTRGDSVLILGDVEYVWRDSGELGDSSPIALTLEFEADLLRSLRVDDDPEIGLAAFES